MDHHHHHHHHHLHSHSSRYVPVPQQQPPAPVFLPPDTYRRQPQLAFPPQPPVSVGLPRALPLHSAVPHHLPDGDFVYVSCAASSSHASDNHGSRLLGPPNLPERLVVKVPQPPVLGGVRVSDRIIFPDGHPEATRVHHHPRRSGDEAFVREGFKRERVRMHDGVQGTLSIGRRMGETVELMEEEEDAARRLGLPGRKRARWGEGRSLGEDPLFDGFHQERDPDYRLSSGPGPTRRRLDVVYDLRKVDEDLSRDSSCVFVPERKEAMITFPRPPPEMPLRSPAYSVSKLEFLGESQMAESENLSPGSSHGLRERSSTGRGKRYVSASEEVFGPVNKAPQQKPSVLTRIQFSKPVYKRKCEQQIVSVTSPLSRPFPFSEGNRFERDVPAELDVSFKTDALVGKEILTSQVSVAPRSFGDARARTAKKDVIMVKRVSPTRYFSKSGCNVTSTHAHKLKIREERFAPSSVEKKWNREMAPKNLEVNETLASSNSFQNFGDEVTPLRTQWSTMASEVSTSLDHKLSSVIREAPDRLTEKKMNEKIVDWQDLDVQDHGAKVTSARSLDKKKQTEELVICQGNTTSNSSENNSMKTVRKLNYDVSLTMEQCPTGGIFKDNLANSADVQAGGIVIVNRTGGFDMNLENETLLGPKVISLHGNEKGTSVIDLKKEVSGNMPPPASVISDAKKTVIARSKGKQDRNTFNPLSSAVNSDRKITRTKLSKKKTIKKNKNKKLFSSVNPCSSNVVSTREIINGHMPAINSVEPLGKNESESTSACSDIQKQYQEEESRDSKHSETVKNVSGVGSSTDMKVIEGRDVKFIAGFPEELSSKVRSPKEEEVKGRDKREFTLMSCALDSGRMGETCGKPLPNTYSERQMHSCDVQIGLLDDNCMEEIHKEKLLGEEVNIERLDAGDMLDSCQDISQLENVHVTSEKIMDSGSLRKCYEQHILSSSHDDAIQQPVLLKKETFDVDASSLDVHLGGTSLRHLDACPVAVPSCAIDPIKIDAEESPKKSFGMHSPSNQRSVFQQDQSRQCCNMNLMEGYECNKHLFASEGFSLPDEVNLEQVQNEGTTFFEEESSPKSKFSIPIELKRQKSSPMPQLNAAQEVLEMVRDLKNAATSLHSPVQGKTVLLQVKAETGVGVRELENDRKSQSPVQGAIVTGNEFGEVDAARDTVATKRSKDLHIDAPGLALESQDALPCVNLLIETDRRHDSAPNLPCMDVFSQASTSTVRVDYSVVNTIAGPGSDRSDSSLLSVSSRSSHEQLVSADKEIPISGHILYNASGLGSNTTEKLFNGSNDEDDSKCLSLAEYDSCGKSDPISQLDFLNLGKTVPQQTQGAEKQANCHQLMDKEKLDGTTVCQRPGSSKTYPNQKIPSTRTYRKPPPHSIRLNKWYRTENPPLLSLSVPVKLPGRSSQKQSPKKHGKTQSSYIRKGNSLIRKSSAAMPASRLQLEQTVVEQTHMLEKSRNMSSEETNVSTNCLSFSSERIMNNSFERPKTPPLPLLGKPIHTSSNNQNLTENSISETARESNSIPSLGVQRLDLTEENHSIPTQEESKFSGKRKVIYVKHRSNQLIAAPSIDAKNSSAHTTDETPALSFSTPDIYYRNKNKLIRDTSSSDGLQKKEISLPNDCTDAKHRSSVMSSLKDVDKVLCKARFRQGDASIAKRKMCKRSRFSLVWTLGGLRSPDEKNYNTLKHQMALPLFPWKRTTYWKGSIANRKSNLTKHSLPLIRNPQLSRQRNTIYTVSKSGFSLRKSGILGVGGAHLKWSKSMERRSRKASKDATLAIVECEKKKKQKHAVSSDPTMKSENCSQRERIFRVGMIRYKMDPSRRTLIRIPDEQMPPVANNQPVHGVKMSIVPRRLLIGNDEYIQIGNGNQLVRDPKKLVRILASEKIRWSLHTARLRAVKKQQYCQFFTRFGKCNKEDGKCPYIHDSTKIAICTKFLNGLCSDAGCKLTHKVIPERMPDCSYFLQGLCTTLSCSYRHVNVNPKAAICEGFLKGYCRDGNECRKKHSYVCPHFEATGECPQRSTCKLHHPKRANKQINKSRKRKRTPIEDHGRGRYFGPGVAEVGQSQPFTSNECPKKDDEEEDIFFRDGRFVEYINMDMYSDDDKEEPDDLLGSHTIMDSDLSDSQSSDADALIKPVRIMKVDFSQ